MSGSSKRVQTLEGRTPVEQSNEVAKSPFSLFPEEVWRIILECLDNSSVDLWNVCKASPTFKRVVLESKQIFMFELVLPVMIPYLQNRDILQSRLVSKSWKNVIDRLLIHNSPGLTTELQTPLLPEPFQNLLTNYTPVISISPLASYFTRHPTEHEEVIEKFIRIFGRVRPEENPVLSSIVRSVNITYDNQLRFHYRKGREFRDCNENYHSKLLRFADLYGEHIHHLKIRFDWDAPSMLLPFRFLRKFLHQTPYLKSLDVFFGLSEKVGPTGELPLLPHLVYLNIGQSKDHEVAKAVFLEYSDYAHGSQLLKLEIWADKEFCSDPEIIRRLHRFRHLKELKLTNIEEDLEVWTLKAFFRGFCSTSPHLKKLTMKLEYIMDDLCPVLESLEPISGSLEYLKIHFCISFNPNHILWTSESEPSGSSVRLQTLHTLEIADTPNLMYDFLLMLPQLRHLKIIRAWKYPFLSDKDREKDEERQKRLDDFLDETGTSFPFRRYLYSDEPQMNLYHHPTLWTSLYQLRKITVAHSTAWTFTVDRRRKPVYFTREGYESEIDRTREQF